MDDGRGTEAGWISYGCEPDPRRAVVVKGIPPAGNAVYVVDGAVMLPGDAFPIPEKRR